MLPPGLYIMIGRISNAPAEPLARASSCAVSSAASRFAQSTM
jgi:hypothetical protein